MAISFQNGVDDDQGFFLGEGGLLLADEMWFFAFHVQEGLEGAWFRFKRVWRLSWGAPGGGNGVLSFYARGQCPVLAKKDWLAFEVGLLFIIKYGMGVF